MSVYQRKKSKSRRWFYQFTVDGVTYKKAIPTARTRRQAEDAERKAREDVHNGTYGILPDIAFRKFVNEHYFPYIEQHRKKPEQVKIFCKFLCGFFGNYTLRQISPLLIEKFKLQHLKTKTVRGGERKASSVNAMLMILSGVLTKAVNEGRLRDNPCRKVKRLPTEATKINTLSPDEEAHLLKVAESVHKYIKPIIQLAVWLGWRVSEIVQLRKCHIDFANGILYAPTAKRAKDPRLSKGVPMSQAVRQVLLDLVSQTKNEFLFPSPQKTNSAYTERRISELFNKACDKAGITGLHFHCLRHTFGTRLGEVNIGIEKIGRLMGHSDPKSTMIYIHTSNESLHKIMETAVDSSSANAEVNAKIVPIAQRKVS